MRFRFLAVIAAMLIACATLAACGADAPIADPRRPDDAHPPRERSPEDDAERMPFEFKGSPVEARWREAVKDVPTWRADAAACRTYCEDWCPRAAECLIGPFSHIGRCKALCLDPCTEGLWPAEFAACARDAKDCKDLRECTRDLCEVFELHPQSQTAANAEGESP